MNNFKLLILLLFLLIITTACSSDDDNQEIYTSEDLSVMHNSSFKNWKLEACYNDHNSKQKSEQNDCLVDDTYTFKPNGITEVIAGLKNCDYGENEIAIVGAS